MAGEVYTYLFLVVSTVAQNNIGTQDSFFPCTGLPPQCLCKDESKYTNGLYHLLVDCSNGELSEVPSGIPNTTTVLALNGNIISEIYDGIFENLILLKYLDLSNNVLKNIKPGIFKGLFNLQTLELNNNQIRYDNASIPETVFEPLRNLKRLNLHQSFASYDVLGAEDYPVESLSSLDNLEQLLLDGLAGRDFAAKFSVLNATKLQRLTMSGKEGRCDLRRIVPGMFNFSRYLITLKIENCLLETVENGSLIELTYLRKLDLSYNEKLDFKSVANISFGLQDRNLYELRLIKINEICGDGVRLEDKDLYFSENITVRHVFLDSNRLAYFSRGTVRYLPKNVSTLSLRDNMLLPGGYVSEFYLSPSFKNLVYLDLSGQTLYREVQKCSFKNLYVSSANISNKVRKRFSDEDTNEKHHVQLTKSDLETMSERKNIREQVTEKTKSYLNITEESSSDRIEHAPSLRSNDSFIIPLEKLSDKLLPMSNNEIKTGKHANTLNLGNDNHSFNNPFVWSDERLNFAIAMGHLMDLDLSFLNLRYEIKKFVIRTPNNLTRVNLQNNVLWNWQGPVEGFENLLNLNLAWNSCEQMSLDFFHTMPGLFTLNISRNFLNPFISNDIDGQIFEKQTHLKRLDLSDNKLTFLPEKIFKNLISLENLYLSDNFLTAFDVVLNSNNLFYIDIGHNRIIRITESTTDILSRVAAANGDLAIDLSNNSLSCSCNDIEFVNWVADSIEKKNMVGFINLHDYQCKYINDSLVNLSNANYLFPKLKRACANYLVLIIVASISVFLVFIGFLSCLLYRYRWNLRYFYYSAKFRMHGYKPLSVNDETDDTFKYDVFVSYASGNGLFVKNTLLPELEGKRQLRVLVHDRDFWAGNFVNDNIMRAITKSRKTLILLSNTFLQSRWCVYEMNMARMESIKTGRDVLCVIMLEHVNVKGLPLEIMDIIRNQTYVEWKNDDNHQDLFWDRVDQAIRQ